MIQIQNSPLEINKSLEKPLLNPIEANEGSRSISDQNQSEFELQNFQDISQSYIMSPVKEEEDKNGVISNLSKLNEENEQNSYEDFEELQINDEGI